MTERFHPLQSFHHHVPHLNCSQRSMKEAISESCVAVLSSISLFAMAGSLPRDVATKKESWSYSLSWRGAEALCQQNDRISKYGNVKAVRKGTGCTLEKDMTKWVERWRRGQHLAEYNVAEMVPLFVIASAVYVSPFPRALSLLWLSRFPKSAAFEQTKSAVYIPLCLSTPVSSCSCPGTPVENEIVSLFAPSPGSQRPSIDMDRYKLSF